MRDSLFTVLVHNKLTEVPHKEDEENRPEQRAKGHGILPTVLAPGDDTGDPFSDLCVSGAQLARLGVIYPDS